MNDTILAVDIGGTQFRLALIRGDEIVARVRKGTQRASGAGWLVERIVEAGRELIAGSPGPVRACGVGFGGPVDFKEQRIIRSHHVPGWDDVPLPLILSEAFGVPCVIENDAATAAIGEHRYGAGRGTRNMIYLTVSTGVGGGIILDGRPYRGSRGYAGEIGHLPVVAIDGASCACGNRGCLEAYCSGPSIARRAQEALEGLREANATTAGAGSPAAGSAASTADTGGSPASSAATARDVFAAAEHDPLMRRVVEDTARYLGAAIAGVCNILDPERVVLGGGVSLSGESFIAAVRAEAHARLLHPGEGAPDIVQAALGDDSVLWGAASLAAELLGERRQPD